MIVSQGIAEKTIDAALSGGADFCEIFAEQTYTSHLDYSDQRASNAVVGTNYGAGIRLFYDKEIIYVHTNDLSETGLIKAAQTAAQAIKGTDTTLSEKIAQLQKNTIHTIGKMPWEFDKSIKIGYLQSLDQSARAVSSLITQVQASLKEANQQVHIINSNGLNVFNQRNYSRIYCTTIAEDKGQLESGTSSEGKLSTSEFFETLNLQDIAKKTVASTLTMLKSDYAPAGEMPVVIENAFGGVIFHEACGHGLETTSVAKGASVFCDQLGKQVASTCVTAIDDGTIINEWGSIDYDDEGAPTQKTTLIENGILKSYIVDQMGARKTGYKPTGSGRRESYKFAPTSRMRNTYIAAGNSSVEEMIAEIDHGLYAVKLGGGSVTPGTGAYNFAVKEAYMIENGKISKPVKGASLIGTGIETLKSITKVGNNLKLAAGNCGSISGWVPVTVGQPAIQVSKLTVGGRA